MTAPQPTCLQRTAHDEQSSSLERLYAVCDPKSTYSLKLFLKQAAIYDSKQPVISSRSSVLSQTPPFVRIPLRLTRVQEDEKDSDEGMTNELLASDDPSINLSPSVIDSLSSHLLGFQWIRVTSPSARLKHMPASPLRRAMQRFFSGTLLANLVGQLPTWEFYDDFVLFQPTAFLSPVWTSALHSSSITSAFFATVAIEFGVSHVARKGLIDRVDVSRQPKLVPLHGVFRSNIGLDGRPGSFSDAFWTATRFPSPRGPITYVWAPSETMYSRGNSSEKCRVAGLGNVTDAVVVDMCCGIGFFAFAYLAAGAAQVIGCELSPWAVEGLRRGAIANGISYQMLEPPPYTGTDVLQSSTARLLIAPCPNELALPIYRHVASHVNLGLLPSSVEFLPQAVEALRVQGGWLHIHGELAVGGGPEGRKQAAEAWAANLVEYVQGIGQRSAELLNIHWIKSIGPAKEHLVVELHVGPIL